MLKRDIINFFKRKCLELSKKYLKKKQKQKTKLTEAHLEGDLPVR